MKTYKGKIDLWYHLSALIMIVSTIVAVIMSLNDEAMLMLVISVFGLVDAIVFSVYLKYKYVMFDTYFLGCFSFINFKVPYKNIIEIEELNNADFNNTASKHKLKITCLVKKENRVLYVSPLFMDEFMEDLLTFNPQIKKA